MTWEDIRNMKEDSLRESLGNPKPRPIKIKGKTYNSYIEYSNSEEYKELLQAIEEGQKLYKESSKEFFESLSYDDQLKCFFHVVSGLYKNFYEDHGSYRHLLYEIFKFGPDSYTIGMDCGMLAIHNDVKTHDEVVDCLNKIFTYLNHIPTRQDFLACYGIFAYGEYNTELIKDMHTGQMKFDFNDDEQNK